MSSWTMRSARSLGTVLSGSVSVFLAGPRSNPLESLAREPLANFLINIHRMCATAHWEMHIIPLGKYTSPHARALRHREKGKPAARRGRKATGLPLGRWPGYRTVVGSQALERQPHLCTQKGMGHDLLEHLLVGLGS